MDARFFNFIGKLPDKEKLLFILMDSYSTNLAASNASDKEKIDAVHNLYQGTILKHIKEGKEVKEEIRDNAEKSMSVLQEIAKENAEALGDKADEKKFQDAFGEWASPIDESSDLSSDE